LNPGETFPGMPEVVSAWLAERASYLHWPPAGREWFGVLRGRSVAEWQALRWERRPMSLNFASLTRESRRVITALANANFCGVQNEYTTLECSGPKFAEIGCFIRENHRLPGDLIFLDDDGLLEIVDGCHRLTLFFMLKQAGLDDVALESQYAVWVGVPASRYRIVG
jgi:hypothetical protein